ncbi:MAG: tail fiber domain-containing protein [Bacteroidota bacterium]
MWHTISSRLVLLLICLCVSQLYAQNSGIGTRNPTHPLHIVPDINVLNPDPIRLEKLRLQQAGDSAVVVVDPAVGILRYLPIRFLSTSGSSGASISGGSSPWYSISNNRPATSNTDNAYLMGNVGIGTNYPTQTLDVNGLTRIRLLPGGSTTDSLVTADENGNLRKMSLARVIGSGGPGSGNQTLALTGNRLTISGGNSIDLPGLSKVFATEDQAITSARRVILGGNTLSFSNDGVGNQDRLSLMANTTVFNQDGLDIDFSIKGNNDPNLLVVDASADKIGLGTPSPSARLDIMGDLRVRSMAKGATSDLIVTTDAYGNLRKIRASEMIPLTNSTSSSSGSTMAVEIDISDPGDNFAGEDVETALAELASKSAETFFTTNGTLTGDRRVSHNNFDLNLDDNTLVISGNDNRVGIGTQSPQEKLQVEGNAYINGGKLMIQNEGFTHTIKVARKLQEAMNADGIAYYNLEGREWHMFGGNVIPDETNKKDLGNFGKRWRSVYTANGAISLSDLRAKKDVQALAYGLKEINQLRAVTYSWKEDSKAQTRLGLIAQEVLKVIPEVVEIPENEEELMGLNYAELVPVLIKGMQEQQQLIDELMKEKEHTEAQVKALNSKLSRIEALLEKGEKTEDREGAMRGEE